MLTILKYILIYPSITKHILNDSTSSTNALNILFKTFCFKQNVCYFCLKNITMNPFVIKNYVGPEYFCDREVETKRTYLQKARFLLHI